MKRISSAILTSPMRPDVDTRDLQHWIAELQTADSVDRVLHCLCQAMRHRPGVGRGAVYVVGDREEAIRREFVEGPASADLSLPEIELTGMARRAIRERDGVKQSGVAAGTLWALPLRSPRGVEGVLAAVGSMEGLSSLLDHAGLALYRERSREEDRSTTEVARRQEAELDHAVNTLDLILSEGGTAGVLRRVCAAIDAIPGVARTALWTLTAEEGRYVETIPADSGSRFSLPESAHRAEGFVEWSATFPRWGGYPWVPGGTVQRVGPASGDTLLLVLGGSDQPHPAGFVLAEVDHPIEDPGALASLHRWVALARHALDARLGTSTAPAAPTEDLVEEKAQLAELHRLKSQFIAAVSHELRTPLTSISAYAETLRAPSIDTQDETRDHFLRVIHDESRRLTRIVDDILDLATMDSGRVRLSCRRVDLTDVVRDAVDVIAPLATRKEIALVNRAGDSAHVHADPDLLKQLAVNLLENAVKFTPAGGTVTIAVESDATAARLSVRDDGPGIPADKLDAIFERFYQVDGTNARAHNGSGLGLAICRSIATWHDGRIWAESGDEPGSRFVVSLPRVRATSRTRAAEPTVTDAPTEDHRVPELVIEMISEVMRAESVSLMLLEPTGSELFVQAAVGLPDEAIREVRLSVGENIAGTVAASGTTLLIPDLDADDRFQASRRGDQYRTRSLISVPVKVRDSVIGVVNVTNKISGESFDAHDQRLLEMLAERVALVLNKLREYGDQRDDVQRMEEAMRGIIDVRRHYFPSGETFASVVLEVCRELGLDDAEAARIHYASILRDVGMTRLPEGTYKKPSELSEHDRELIRRHPEEGARVLRSIEFLPDVFDIILAHHEEPDGSGYPRGLTAGGIPLGAKILSVVDAWDSLRTGRPYRAAVPEDIALEEVVSHRGKQFDPDVVDALCRVMERKTERVTS